jgi:hypothetical protein
MSGKAAATSGEGLSGPTPSSKVDEAHWANNLPFATRLERVKGLPNPAECQCATDVFLKTQWLLERGGGIVFATGTPIANTIAESWTTARYLMLPTPEELGLHHFDAWAKLLGHVTAEMSLRYGRLFDATVRADYERALVLTKGRLGPVLPSTPAVETDRNWQEIARHQGAPGWRLLPADAGPGCLPLRQYMRTLPELSLRADLLAHPRYATCRYGSPGRRCRGARLGRRGRAPSPPDRASGPAHGPGPGIVRQTDLVKQVEQVCVELNTTGEDVTFATVAARTGSSRSTLYRHPELRALIGEHRLRGREAVTLTGPAVEIDQLRQGLADVVLDGPGGGESVILFGESVVLFSNSDRIGSTADYVPATRGPRFNSNICHPPEASQPGGCGATSFLSMRVRETRRLPSCPGAKVRVRDELYAGRASMMLMSNTDPTGTARSTANPAKASRDLNSASVRSLPPSRSIDMSRSLPGCGNGPGGMTCSMISSRPASSIARRI